MIAEENRLDRFMFDEEEFDEMIALGKTESRCELCSHYVGNTVLTYGERLCKAYQKGKTIPDRIWDDGTGNYHEKVQSDQIGDFIFRLIRRRE